MDYRHNWNLYPWLSHGIENRHFPSINIELKQEKMAVGPVVAVLLKITNYFYDLLVRLDR